MLDVGSLAKGEQDSSVGLMETAWEGAGVYVDCLLRIERVEGLFWHEREFVLKIDLLILSAIVL